MKNGFTAFVARCRRQKTYAELGLPRVSMALTLYQLKEHQATVGAEMAREKEALAEMLGNPASEMKVTREKKERVADLKERYDGISEQIAEMESEARARLAADKKGGGSAQMSKQEAKGRFFQSVLNGSNVRELPQMVYDQLGAIPANDDALGTGSNLLPTQMANELLLEPLVQNPLRAFMTVTNVTGLEIPKLGFAVDDDEFVLKDGATAKEMKLKGDKVSFGRKKMMLRAKVSETVLRSSALNVEGAVTSGLNSAQAAKELKVIFNQNPTAADEKTMSLYTPETAIKRVKAKTMLDSILDAYGDLEDLYVPNARVCMRRIDYIKMIRELANGSEALFGKKPEDIIGVPVIFCDRAVVPVVGDWQFLHLNFDCPPLYDTDKEVDTGMRKFVLTHWYDIKIKMSSAFRIAEVDAA